jgi:hypothetical protein
VADDRVYTSWGPLWVCGIASIAANSFDTSSLDLGGLDHAQLGPSHLALYQLKLYVLVEGGR